jgi:hypothetical protein
LFAPADSQMSMLHPLFAWRIKEIPEKHKNLPTSYNEPSVHKLLRGSSTQKSQLKTISWEMYSCTYFIYTVACNIV